MLKPIVYADITRLRRQYHSEQDNKLVAISPYLEVRTDALDIYLPISVTFAGSGAWHCFYAVTIHGGPDHGKRVDTRPWQPEESLEYGATVYNGNREEYDKNLGYPARPMIERADGGSLHAVTVSYLTAMLVAMRERDMADHLNSLHERLDKEES